MMYDFNMPLTLSLGDLTKVITETSKHWFDKSERTRAEQIAYLERIAKDARELAEIWSKIYAEFALAGESELHAVLPAEVLAFINGPAQGLVYGELAGFYAYASRAVGGRMDEEWRSTIFDCLGRLLYQRTLTKQAYIDALNDVQSKFVLNDMNESASTSGRASAW